MAIDPTKPVDQGTAGFLLFDSAMLAAREFWRERLAGVEPSPSLLPSDPAGPAAPSGRGEVPLTFDEALTRRLLELTGGGQFLLATVFFAATAAVQHLYSGADELVLGSPLRSSSTLDAGPGGVAIRIRIDRSQGFKHLLMQVRQALLDAYAHQQYPLERVLEDHGGGPLFDTVVRFAPIHGPAPRAGLGLVLAQTGDELRGVIEHDRARFATASVARLARHFVVALRRCVGDPAAPLAELSLLDADELRTTTITWNQTAAPRPAIDRLDLAIIDQAARTPDAIAVATRAGGEPRSLTYAALIAEAGALARALEARGVAAGERVAIFMPRSVEVVVAVLGALMAGCAFVPLDLASPRERVEFILADAGVAAILTHSSVRERLPTAVAAPVLAVDDERPPPAAELPRPAITAEDLAYLIYTSGSTGRPKGCAVMHRNATHYLDWAGRHYLGEPGERGRGSFGLYSSLAFDLTITSLFLPLLRGRTLHVYPEDVHVAEVLRDSFALGSPIDAIKLTPSHLRLAAGLGLERSEVAIVILGGEAVTRELVEFAHRLNPAVELHNEYGPTEATVGCVVARLRPDDERVLIGRPIANMRAYVVGRDDRPCPIGVPGELLVAGEGVTRGYVGRADLDARAFVASPELGEERLYRTGDRVRWTEDGALEYLGRRDDQIKLHGYRIELGEIEASLREHPEIDEAVVALERLGDDDALVMYVVGEQAPGHPVLARWLGERVPEYMVPAFTVALERLPITANGKVDRAALPRPRVVGAGAAARDEVEAELVRMWTEVLGVDGVGIHDDFFALGGQSLSATQVMSRIHREFAIELGWGSIFANPTIAALAELVRAGLAAAGHGRERRAFAAIPPAPAAERYPVSISQRRLWLLARLDGDRGAYNIADAIELRGPLDPSLMERTIAALIERHEVLRTTFVDVEGEAFQVVHPTMPFVLAREDVERLDPERLVAEALIPFDLERGPLVRGRLLRLGPARHVLILTVHHIVCDGWSLAILGRETMAIYAALARGHEPDLPPLPIQYKDYVVWQRERLTGPEAAGHRDYWRAKLGGERPTLELPADRPRPPVRSVAGGYHRRALPSAAMTRLAELGRTRGASTFMACVSLLASLVSRYVGQRELVLGIPAFGRPHIDLEHQVGFYANTLPLILEVDGGRSFAELLGAHAEAITAAQEHQEFPLEQMIGELGLHTQTNRNPLFDVGVQVDEALPTTELPGLEVEALAIPSRTSKFDLMITFRRALDGAWSVGFEYSADLFDEDRVARMAEHLATLLEGIVDAPERPIAEQPIVPGPERARILDEFNPPAAEYAYPREQSIAALFGEVARRSPEAIAAVGPTRRLTYAELDARSAALASALIREHGVRPGATVGVLVPRTERAPILLLAILRAGAAYLPLESSWPDSRLAFILADAGCELVLTEPDELERPGLAQVRRLETTAWTIEPVSATAIELPPVPGGEALAYVAYTSGSTGEPKGALICQRSVARLVRATNYVDLGPADRILSTGSLAFDASTFEIWGALLNGGRVCLTAAETLLDPAAVRAVLRAEGITVAFLTTALFNQLAEADAGMFAGLRVLLTGGEKVSVAHINRVRARCPQLDLLHVYGPTENTTFSTAYRVRGPHEHDVPIGGPIANTSAYIVDAGDRLVPIGVPGEILLGGDGVALGYLARPELSAARFIANPFGPGRLYRTGDVGRWNRDGEIEFVGRVDNQVKIRGFRVEPGEIEIAMRRHPAVAESVVVTRRTEVGTLELIGYYVAREPLAPEDLRAFLAESLPKFMVPAYLVVLDALPLNTSGKIDRRALPEPERVATPAPASTSEAHDDPRLATLLETLSELLAGATIGLDDNLFELGFDSIKAIQLINRLGKRGLALAATAVYMHPTARQLVEHVEAAAGVGAAERLRGPVPLTPVQRWFFATSAEPRPLDHFNHFNQDVLLRVREPSVDLDALAAALTAIVDHHDALRMRFELGEPGEVIQQCTDAGPPAVQLVDLRDAPEPGAALTEHANFVHAALDLADGPIMRVVVYRLPDGDRLLWVIHHLVVDGVSWRILLDDLEHAYAQAKAGAAIELGPKTATLADWARALERHAESDARAELPYWTEVAATPSAPLPVAAAAVDPAVDTGTWGASRIVHARLEREVSERLVRSRSSVQASLLSALARAIDRRSEGRAGKVLITLEGHGRERIADGPDLSRTVGWFTSLYPFVLEPVTVAAQAARLAAVPGKGLGYGLLELECAPELAFNYLGELEAGGATSLFGAADEDSGEAIAAHLPRVHAIDLVALITDRRLSLTIRHDGRHDRASVEALLDAVIAELEAIAANFGSEPEAEPEPELDERLRTLLLANRWALGRARDIAAVVELTPLQHGLMFQAAVAPEARAYHLQNEYEFHGDFDPDRLLRAWALVHERHASLRSSFVLRPEPASVVWRERGPEVLREDLRGLDRDAQERRLADHRARDLARGFDLAEDPLMRLAIHRLADDRHRLLWSFHHIIVDGWSVGVLLDELARLYDALPGGAPTLAPAPAFAGYLSWLAQRDREAAARHWQATLADFDRPTPIALAHVDPGADDEPERDLCFGFGPELSRGLEALARDAGVTLYTIIQALWAVVLARYNRRDEVVFGTVVSGRPGELAGAERMVGLFINTVPVRVRLGAAASLVELLRALLSEALASEPHRYVPLSDILEHSPLGAALFDHLLIFENYPRSFGAGAAADDERGFTVTELDWRDRTHYGLCVVVTPGAEIHVRLSYDAAKLSTAAVEGLAAHLRTVAASAVATPGARPLDLELLPAAERARLLDELNRTAAPPSAATVLDRFAATVATSPEAIAVTDDDGAALRYRELDERARTLATRLVDEHRVVPGEIVVLFMERSAATVVAVLGVLLAGAAYLPLEPGDPPARIASILAEHPRAVILVDAAARARLELERARILDVATLTSEPTTAELPPVTPEDLAYVIYTSGSSGRPKGCLIDHGNLHAYLDWAAATYRDGRGDFGLFTSLSFDLTVTSLFVPLIRGRKVHVFATARPLEELMPALFDGRHGIDTVKLTPAHVSVLATLELSRSEVAAAIVGGDALRPSHLETLRRLDPAIAIYNEYGPTEATVGCVVERCDADDGPIAIGRPITNTRVYLLDPALRLQPLGVPGQLYLAGAGLSRGYLDRPELTRERFIDNPHRVGERLYATGDLARFWPDGRLEYLGREDRQIKLRGHRIELPEIEARLAEQPGVTGVAVTIVDSPTRGPELAAYYTAGAPKPSPEALREGLRATLPAAMIPTYLIELERIPLTPHGKLDAARLPPPAESDLARAPTYRPPQTLIEARLAQIWRRILGVRRVGLDDGLFELGGHSLKAMQIVAAIHRELGVKIPVATLFSNSTIAALAPIVGAGETTTFDAIMPAPPRPHYDVSAAQRRLWLLHQMRGERAYNMPESLVLDGEVDVDALRRTFATLVDRHEILRTAFVVVDGEPRQRILPALELPVRVVDLRELEPSEADDRARLIAQDDAVTPFDLAKPPLLRVTLIRLPRGRHLFLVNIHHIIGDGWSSNVLAREFNAVYQAYRRGRPNPLEPLRIQYKDFSEWQNAHAFEREGAYWAKQLAGLDGILELPTDARPEAGERSFRGAVERVALDPAVVAGLRRYAAAHETTLSTVVLALVKLLLHRLTKQRDLCVGLGVANRDHAELENMLGFFVNVLLIRTRFEPNMEFDELVASLSETVYAAFEHQRYPFDRLVRELGAERMSNWQPLINVVYAFQNFSDVRVELAWADDAVVEDDAGTGLDEAHAYQLEFETSKFDLVFFAFEARDNLLLSIEYDSDMFHAPTIRKYLTTIERFAMMVAGQTESRS